MYAQRAITYANTPQRLALFTIPRCHDTHRSNTNDSHDFHREGQAAAIKTIPIAISLWCTHSTCFSPPLPLNSSTRWPLKSMDGNSTLRNSVTLHKRRSTKRNTLANGYTPLSLWNLCKRFGHALKRTKDKRFPIAGKSIWADLITKYLQAKHARR